MATKFFLTDAAAPDLSSDVDRLLSLTAGDGTGLKTDVANTVASGTQIQMTDTAGGTAVRWITNPLNAVTIVGNSTKTINLWMSESSMSANVQAGIQWGTYSGTTFTGRDGPAGLGSELPVTTRAAQNFTRTPPLGDITLAAGDRLYVIVWGLNIGTMGGSFTFDLSYNGTSGGADGDTWFQWNETITEQAVRTPRNPVIDSDMGVLCKAHQAVRRWRHGKHGILVPEISFA